ncbi:MAG: hypothetical protein E6501_22995, partial [Bradyrhizobium sp.]|nr:hypothetical protein [Bradyrhizobium sp.]
MPLSARAAALRSTALSKSLSVSLAAGLTLAWGLAGDIALAKDKVPLPKARPIARSVVPGTAAKEGAESKG